MSNAAKNLEKEAISTGSSNEQNADALHEESSDKVPRPFRLEETAGDADGEGDRFSLSLGEVTLCGRRESGGENRLSRLGGDEGDRRVEGLLIELSERGEPPCDLSAGRQSISAASQTRCKQPTFGKSPPADLPGPAGSPSTRAPSGSSIPLASCPLDSFRPLD